MQRILIIIGTRPEAIKLAPVILRLKESEIFEPILIVSGQHKDLVMPILNLFKIKPDFEILVENETKTLGELTGKLFLEINKKVLDLSPSAIVAQGDTTTVMVSSIIAFTNKIAFWHVEAGLRSRNLNSPFPEEFNRRVATLATSIHFCPTDEAKQNLLHEGIKSSSIFVVGNTVIDSLYQVIKISKPPEAVLKRYNPIKNKLLLFTTHRRENFGHAQSEIFKAIERLTKSDSSILVVIPVHPNPEAKMNIEQRFKDNSQVILLPPLPYDELVWVMNESKFVITDSGGIQEEAPALGKPVVIIRNETERPEIVTEGLGVLVGTDTEKIFNTCAELLSNKSFYQSMAKGYSPYGDGTSAEQIFEILKNNNKT